MNKLASVIFLCCCIVVGCCLADEANGPYRGDRVFRLFPLNDDHKTLIQQFQHEHDVWGHVYRGFGEPVDIRVERDRCRHFEATLNATQLPYRIQVDDVQDMLDRVERVPRGARRQRKPQRASSDVVGRWASYEDIVAWTNSICEKYATLASCGTYGKSTENRTLVYMKFGKAPIGKQNAIFIEAGMHAREWINPASTIYFVNNLITTYNTDATSKRMLDNWNFYVTFISNPDGYEYSRNKERLWRKTRSKAPSGNCYGTDPNRNYDIYWATVGSSNSPCSDTYHGPKAFSEPETKANSDLVLQHKDEILGYFAIHSYAQMWLVPYGYTTGSKPADYSELLRVAQIGGKALMAINNKKWDVGNSADILYACAGASDDWAKIKAGIKYSYTLELRPASTAINGFIVSETEILPSGKELSAGLIAAIDAMQKN